jgi:hypothetical protein
MHGYRRAAVRFPASPFLFHGGYDIHRMLADSLLPHVGLHARVRETAEAQGAAPDRKLMTTGVSSSLSMST